MYLFYFSIYLFYFWPTILLPCTQLIGQKFNVFNIIILYVYLSIYTLHIYKLTECYCLLSKLWINLILWFCVLAMCLNILYINNENSFWANCMICIKNYTVLKVVHCSSFNSNSRGPTKFVLIIRCSNYEFALTT